MATAERENPSAERISFEILPRQPIVLGIDGRNFLLGFSPGERVNDGILWPVQVIGKFLKRF